VKITKKLLTWRRNSGADVEIIATSLGGAGHKQVAVFVLWSKLSLANF
jgi:nanoRNase/pAp phosphatase (c-di-AMP/oligoRNAs hydrolase)